MVDVPPAWKGVNLKFERSSKIIHRGTGAYITTPLLIPSFSSKTFGYRTDTKSELDRIIQYTSEFITRSYLISTFDIYHEMIPSFDNLPFNVEIMFLDSGGYECSWNQDYSSVSSSKPITTEWQYHQHQEIVRSWPIDLPSVIVNYDHPTQRISIKKQVEQANQLFDQCREHLHLFLIKPEDTSDMTLKQVIEKICDNPKILSSFDLVGLTEKELGDTMLSRMESIAKIRVALDNTGLNIPLHIFGALDPISVLLYYTSGAEIFDGLTWLRYAYSNNQCIYINNHSTTEFGLHANDTETKLRILADNIYVLEELELKMRNFAKSKNYKIFAPHDELVYEAEEALIKQLGGIL